MINSGSTENVISNKVVKNMNLKMIKHPNPYKISWVKGMNIQVNKMCNPSFSIGKNFINGVLCDVINMDICHHILGRPWQYEIGALYDGRRNYYII